MEIGLLRIALIGPRLGESHLYTPKNRARRPDTNNVEDTVILYDPKERH